MPALFTPTKLGNKLVKVLVGQRRAGKSYILRQIASKLLSEGVDSKNILYINKEYMELATLRSTIELEQLYKAYRQKIKPKGKVYIFIDEWERFVNSHSQDFAEPSELFISGSNSNLLSGELATLLSGRYVEFEVFSFSFTEYCGITRQETGKESYTKFLQGGALPELFNLPSDEMKQNYVSSIKDTVMLRDIVGRYKVKDVKLLDDLFVYLANSAANKDNNPRPILPIYGIPVGYTPPRPISSTPNLDAIAPTTELSRKDKEILERILADFIDNCAYSSMLSLLARRNAKLRNIRIDPSMRLPGGYNSTTNEIVLKDSKGLETNAFREEFVHFVQSIFYGSLGKYTDKGKINIEFEAKLIQDIACARYEHASGCGNSLEGYIGSALHNDWMEDLLKLNRFPNYDDVKNHYWDYIKSLKRDHAYDKPIDPDLKPGLLNEISKSGCK